MKDFEYFYYLIKYLIYIFYIISFLNIWNRAPDYLNYLLNLWQIFVGFILIALYNPYYRLIGNKIKYDVAYNAGFLIILTLITKLFGSYNDIIKNVIDKVFDKSM